MLNSYYAAILTLYDRRCQIDETAQKRYIRFLIDRGVRGFFPCGTSGEYTNLTQKENLRLLELLISENQEKKPVIPCASTASIHNSVELIHRMEEMGITEVSVCPPYYAPLRQSDILDYYHHIIKNTNVGLYLYNIPAFTNPISFETFERLLPNPRILGIKDSSGSMKTISHYLANAAEQRETFCVMTGTDEMILPALCAGCSGSVSALSGILPEVHNLLYDTYLTDLPFARKLQLKLTALAAECEKFVFPVGYKLALEARGFEMPAFRQNVVEQKNPLRYNEAKVKIGAMVTDLIKMAEKRKAGLL